MNHVETCPHCKGKMVKYRHALSSNLVAAMARLYEFAGTEPRHVGCQETGITVYQWNNFQKLRYFALVAPHVTKENEHKRGWWHVTERGAAFLHGLITVRGVAVTFRGEVVAMEGPEVKINDLLPGYKTRREYIEDREPVRDDLFGRAGIAI